MRRVVVTGLGLITPIGLSVDETWNNLLRGESGVRKIDRFDVSKISSKIAGLVRDFQPQNYINPKDIRMMDLFIQYGVAASIEAVEDAGFIDFEEKDLDRIGVIIGSGIGGLRMIEETTLELYTRSGKVTPFFVPGSLINLVSGQVSIRYGLRGPNHSVVTACASGAHAITDAARLIKCDDADVMIAGGSEAAITPLGVSGFTSPRALSTKYNEQPEKASRPWDKNRDGFVIAEGAGIVVLEEMEHAKKRGAKIYAEILGCGLSGDAYHATSPHPEGLGAKSAMRNALKNAKINKNEVGYINAHGTSTVVGDLVELSAVQSVFYDENPSICMSSTKSSIGHLLGAAGSVEMIFTILAIHNKILPATLNLEEPILETKIDLIPHKPKEKHLKYAMTNSFGFGGTNISVILGST